MRYLSDEWFEAADAAVRDASPAPVELTIDQHVDGSASWRVAIGVDSRIQRLDSNAAELPDAADAVFRQAQDTAAAIARGDRDSHQAFLLGEIRFEGDIDRIIERRAGLDWLHAALEPVMARTGWN